MGIIFFFGGSLMLWVCDQFLSIKQQSYKEENTNVLISNTQNSAGENEVKW